MPAQAIVSLLPSATEIIFAIGAGDQLVGVTHECDYPEAAAKLRHVTASSLPLAGSAAEIDRHVRRALHAGSSLYSLDAELLERLAPDLIVTQELCEVCAVSYETVTRSARRLQTDPRIVSLEPRSIDDVYETILTLGGLTGRILAAEELVTHLTDRVTAVTERTRNRDKPRVLVLEWTDPPMSAGHWTPGLVELAGGIPLLANPGADSDVLKWDEIAEADADVIVVAPCGFDLTKAQGAMHDLENLAEWRNLRAVQQGRAFAVDGNAYVNRPGPRLADTIEILAGLMHG